MLTPLGGGLNSHNIFEEISSLENLFLAWREFKKGKTRKPDVQEFEFNLEENIFQLHQKLKEKTYRHSPYAAFYITDPKLRHIHKACVRDRVLHHAIFRILYSIFDPTFIFDSYSCRLGKGTHRAVKRFKKFTQKLSNNNTRNIFILKCDIKKFFDSVDQAILISLVERIIKDRNLCWLVEVVVKSFKKEPNLGLPIGNVTSQLFANIYLNELDQYVKHKLGVRYYIRYCDDFIILGTDYIELADLTMRMSNFLKDRLKLFLHPSKISIRKYRQGIDFLGYVVRPNCVTLRTKTKRRLLENVDFVNLPSYLGVLKHCDGFKIKKAVGKRLNH